jgi:UDP-GlcNAc3NAcA epimerase
MCSGRAFEAALGVPGQRPGRADGAREEAEAAEDELRGHGCSATFAGGVRILSVVGNRPQLRASVPVSLALRERGAEEIVVEAGGQDELRKQLALPPPTYRLETGTDTGTEGEETGRLLTAIETILLAEKPDAVLVFGNTNATLAGALAAGKLLLPVAHVGAGLRSYDRSRPDELNCVLVDRLAGLLFCPTEAAVENLAAEGITDGVHLVGDVLDESAGAHACAKIADLLIYDESR